MARRRKPKTQNVSEPASESAEKPAEEETSAVDLPNEELSSVPSVEECLEKGYSRVEADLIIKGITLAEKGPGALNEQESLEPAYLVSSPRNGGMWRIGRHFEKTPVRLLASELTEQERATFEKCNPRHIKVEKVNFV